MEALGVASEDVYRTLEGLKTLAVSGAFSFPGSLSSVMKAARSLPF
jgi:hypothetical protein